MSIIGKICSWLVLILSILFLGISLAHLSTAKNYKLALDQANKDYNASVKTLTAERDELEADKRRIELDLAKATNDLKNEQVTSAGLAQEVASQKSLLVEKDREIAAFDLSLTELRNKFGELKDKYQAHDEQLQRLVKEREEKIQENAKLNAEIKAVKDENTQIKNRNLTLAAANKELTEANQAMMGTLNSLRDKNIITDLDTQVGAVPVIYGKITAVDHTLGRVIINRGTDQGVKKNFNFTVFRGPDYLGMVRIDNVEEDRCSGKIDPELSPKPGQIRKGDDAATKI